MGTCRGRLSGIGTGPSAVLAERLSMSRGTGSSFSLDTLLAVNHIGTTINVPIFAYQQPPAFSCRSNTRTTSNDFSWTRASTAMAPAGPVPMTATLLFGGIFGVCYLTVEIPSGGGFLSGRRSVFAYGLS